VGISRQYKPILKVEQSVIMTTIINKNLFLGLVIIKCLYLITVRTRIEFSINLKERISFCTLFIIFIVLSYLNIVLSISKIMIIDEHKYCNTRFFL